MKNQIRVLDDVIPKEMQDSIEDLLLGDKMTWHFCQDLTRMRKQIKEEGLTDLSPYFWVSFLEDVNNLRNELMIRKMAPIVEHACQRLDLHLAKLLQGRMFLVPPLDESLRRKYTNIHVDTKTDHLVCLYYVNDADGDTILFDKTTDDVTPFEPHNNRVEFNEIQRVTPKKGRCVVFDGRIYHSAQSPAKHTRCAINFNFLIR
jgi:hypothetical protein